MATEYVQCDQCDTEFKVKFQGISRRTRKWQVENKTWTCSDCWEQAKDDANAKATTEAEKRGLPELIGSDKQIQWAETLRMKFINGISDLKIDTEELKKSVIHAQGQTKSSFWIDNRFQNPQELILNASKSMKTPEENITQTIEKDLALKAAAEATMRPESTSSETVAEISINKNQVKVRFPERLEDFRTLIRYKLGFTWRDGYWGRNCSSVTDGNPEDRAAETGHTLLANGFCIRIYDDGLRGKTISGEFEPECTKWVCARTKGKYAGHFAIWWKRDSGNYYGDARRLTASKWDKPDVVVPSEQFEEVLDFAEIHEFRLTSGAVELAEQAKIAKDSVLTVCIELKPKTKNPNQDDGKPPILDIPNVTEIDDEFMDEI